MGFFNALTKRRAGLFCLVLLGMPAAASTADTVAGQSAYAICASCHGARGEGNVALNAPRLAGQAGWYLQRQMEAFQKGWRGTAPGDSYGMQMRPMAIAVGSAEALDNLVAYIATLPDVLAEPTVTGDLAEGQAGYGVCAACHGPDGRGNEQLGGPRLAGQDDWYLVRQLQNYQQGLRAYHARDVFGMQMKPMAAMLVGDKAVNDVVAYINSLR